MHFRCEIQVSDHFTSTHLSTCFNRHSKSFWIGSDFTLKRHPRRSDEEWLSIIKECRTSGLPDKTWCLDHGIQPSKFYYHIRRLKAKACEITQRDKDPHLSAQRQEVVQLFFGEPQGSCIPEVTPAQMEAVVRMNFHGIQLEISNHAERETIADAIAVLQCLC